MAEASFDGRNATIVAGGAGGEQTVVVVPEDKLFIITRFHVSNNNPAATRVRFWDSFTDSEGNVHDAATNPILLGDFNLQPDETVESTQENGLAKAIGTVIARATVAGAAPADVTAGAWGLFE